MIRNRFWDFGGPEPGAPCLIDPTIHAAVMLYSEYPVSRLEPQVETDGRTVWVNAPNCIGRFCPLSGEVMLHDGQIEGTKPDWLEWKTLMRIRHDFVVDDKYKPAWSKT